MMLGKDCSTPMLGEAIAQSCVHRKQVWFPAPDRPSTIRYGLGLAQGEEL